MGSGSNRNPEGGFSIYEWDEEPDLIAGVKVLYNTNNKRSNDLPAYSDTSTMYFKRDANGEIIQLRIYDPITHEAKYDIDINPQKSHKNKDGTFIDVGVTHIHEWRLDKKGELVRGKRARLLTSLEQLCYNDILQAANDHVKYQ